MNRKIINIKYNITNNDINIIKNIKNNFYIIENLF